MNSRPPRPSIVITPLAGDEPARVPAPPSAEAPAPVVRPKPKRAARSREPRRRRTPSYYLFVAVGALGRTMITVGVLLMLFVAYQLWGTGLHESRAQSSLTNELEELLSTSTATPQSSTTTTAAAAPVTTIAPTTEPPSAELMAAFENGDAIARLRIPKIDVDKVVVEGVQVEDLRKGPGHYRSTPYPGQKGNAAIAGHRTTYGAPFNRIDELEPGDEILVTTPQGQFTYTVLPQTNPADGAIIGHLIVDPSEVWVLDDAGDNRLTLTACHPKFSARSRIVVQAKLKEPPAPTPKQPAATDPDPVAVDDPGDPAAARDTNADLDEGLGGDRSQLRPTLVWGALLAIGFLLVACGTKRWGRRFSWPAGVLPLVLVTFVFFEHLDRLLPAR